jgi:hypothetical protein
MEILYSIGLQDNPKECSTNRVKNSTATKEKGLKLVAQRIEDDS